MGESGEMTKTPLIFQACLTAKIMVPLEKKQSAEREGNNHNGLEVCHILCLKLFSLSI